MKSSFLLLAVISILAVSTAAQDAVRATGLSSDKAEPIRLASVRPESHKPTPSPTNDLVSRARRMELDLFSQLNAIRVKEGLHELVWNDDVAAVARLHSTNMAEQNFFSHRGSDGSMVDDRADKVGLGKWRLIGENIAYVRGFDDPGPVAVEKWLESTSHRENLLRPNWEFSAVGVAITADGVVYITQVFLLR